MKKSKAILSVIAMAALCATVFAAPKKFNARKSVTVISREEGSGTRGAFVELFGIEWKEGDKKVDHTTDEADITNSTAVMLTSVAGNQYAIGYVSLGSLNDKVKTLKIDGVEPTVQNIKNGSYKISRPFNIVTTDNVSENAADFISFIMSKEGQAVVEKAGYIAVSSNPSYVPSGKTGKVTVGGSSSVTPVMEKLSEAYEALNPGMNVEVQMSDSTTGVNSAISGVFEIGMASRALKDSEISKGAKGTEIAIDGIAVIINKDNTTDSASVDSIKNLYTGEISKWKDVK